MNFFFGIKYKKLPVLILENLIKKYMPDIPIYVPLSDEGPVDETIISNKLAFLSFHQSKGLERKVVFVFNFDNSYFKYYEKEYEGSEEFFGFFENQRKIYRSYQEAKIYAQTFKLKNLDEWHKHTKNVNFPKDIPIFPYKFYKNEFEGMDVFLGINKVKN